ncbi:MAG: hypothetical protein MRY83_07290 [Flavobacteriales bacterium]|nr:hypothetical protein [Flavobacteriales bacterium]
MKTYSKIMEVIWVILGVGSIIYILYRWINGMGFEDKKIIFALPLIAGFQFYMRRRFRKNMEKNNFRNQND